MQSYEVWSKLSISRSTLGVSAKCILLAQSLESSENLAKVLKFSAKTSALTKVQKAEPHHGLSHVLEVNLEFCTFVCRGPTGTHRRESAM